MTKALDRAVALLCLWSLAARSSSFLLLHTRTTSSPSTGPTSGRWNRPQEEFASAVHDRLRAARGNGSSQTPFTILRATKGSSKSSPSDSRSRSATSPTSKKSPVRHEEEEDEDEEEVDTRATASKPTRERTLEFELVPSIADISQEEWDACLVDASPPSDSAVSASSSSNDASTMTMTMKIAASPFLEHAWIRCLEESECASPSTGWVPQHLRLRLDGTVAGYVPLYIKGHSLGEFIFDQPWADAAYQNGIDYYPKLLVGVPFTPATGPRVLWHPSVRSQFQAPHERTQLLRAVGAFLRTLARSNRLSSVHVNFLTDREATDWTGPIRQLEENTDEEQDDGDENGKLLKSLFRRLSPRAPKDDYLRRTSLQYHWVNVNPQTGQKYQSFQEYLSCFKSKRRITIKRERAKVREDAAIVVDTIRGRDILLHDGLVERMFEIYKSTIDKMEWGRQYLTLDFFRAIANSSFVDNLCFLCARYKDGAGSQFRSEDVFAGTFSTYVLHAVWKRVREFV
jgi:uncharacterized protein